MQDEKTTCLKNQQDPDSHRRVSQTSTGLEFRRQGFQSLVPRCTILGQSTPEILYLLHKNEV